MERVCSDQAAQAYFKLNSPRFDSIEVMDEPKRVFSNFVKGYETLPVRIAG